MQPEFGEGGLMHLLRDVTGKHRWTTLTIAASALALVTFLPGCVYDSGLQEVACDEEDEGTQQDGKECRDGYWVDIADAGPISDTSDANDAADASDAADTADASDTADANPCGEGLTRCGEECVDLSQDPDHCGACGSDCSNYDDNSLAECREATCERTCADGHRDENGDWVDQEDVDDTDGCEVECEYNTFYEDRDEDGYGVSQTTREACTDTPPDGWADQDGDCDDEAPNVNPGADEICTSDTDEDCDGDVGCADEDCGTCNGDGCDSHDQCVSGFCAPDGTCGPDHCDNGEHDEDDETGTDCGGDCPACNGESCSEDVDCYNEVCEDGTCYPKHCGDGNTNGDAGETDEDCGGDNCPACENGNNCDVDDDCSSDYCHEQDTCYPSHCADNQENEDETGLDCGGSCPTCNEEACTDHTDCASGFCDPEFDTCYPAHCDDETPNEDETDEDCGGSCHGCADGEECEDDDDCTSGSCTQQGGSPNKKCDGN